MTSPAREKAGCARVDGSYHYRSCGNCSCFTWKLSLSCLLGRAL